MFSKYGFFFVIAAFYSKYNRMIDVEGRGLGGKENGYPCFGWNSYPCYIHVVVQQVEFGLQRQDETAGKKKCIQSATSHARRHLTKTVPT